VQPLRLIFLSNLALFLPQPVLWFVSSLSSDGYTPPIVISKAIDY